MEVFEMTEKCEMPMTLVGSPDAVAMWPEVTDDDWCGEHQSKTERHPLNLVEIAVSNEQQRCIDAVIDIGRFVSDENWSDRFNEIVDKIKSPR